MKARTKKKKRPLRYRLLLFLFLFLLLSVGGYYILSLPIWRIQEVAVSGTNLLVGEEIRKLSGVPFSDNLFLADLSRTRNNLKKITTIKEFHIYRIPPATVLIRIREREPIAVVVLKGRSIIVDREGYILNRNPNLTLNIPNQAELPVVSGIATEELQEGERLAPKISHLLTDIVLELSNLLGPRRVQLELKSFEKIGFRLDDLLYVKLGRDENVGRKMEVFKALLPVIANKWPQVEYVDVRYPDNPVIKYK